MADKTIKIDGINAKMYVYDIGIKIVADHKSLDSFMLVPFIAVRENPTFFEVWDQRGGKVNFKDHSREKLDALFDLGAVLTIQNIQLEKVSLDLIFTGIEGIGIVEIIAQHGCIQIINETNEDKLSFVIEDSVVKQIEKYVVKTKEKLKALQKDPIAAKKRIEIRAKSMV